MCLLAGLCSFEFFALAGPDIRKSRKTYITVNADLFPGLNIRATGAARGSDHKRGR